MKGRRHGAAAGLPCALFFVLGLAAAGLSSGCAAIPRPGVLAEVEQVRHGPAAQEARTYAPVAFEHAEKLRRDAEAAFDAGDLAGSQLLGERSIAAFSHALALARIARSEAAETESEAALGKSKSELATLDAEGSRVSADAEALELRVKVARDAQPIAPSGRADPEREKARLDAARALALQARLLCSAARLLSASAAAGPPAAPATPETKLATQLDEATAAVTRLDEKLGPAAVAAPIDEATRARATCLGVLTAIRRGATPVAKAPGAGDSLLAELSAMGTLAPSRDDRGVVVTLRGLFKKDELSPPGEARVAELGRIAAAHASFPVEIVVHHDRPLQPRDEAAQRARADAVARSLSRAAPASRVEAIVAGPAAPIVDPTSGDRARNARVEIVFVTPESF